MDADDAAPARILAALDPTGPSEEAERLALVLARATGAELVLGTVFPIIRLRSYVHSRPYESQLRREAERYLAGRADALRELAPELAIATQTTGSVSAAHGLHRLARELDAGMVVLGPSRRRSSGHRVPGPMGARFAHGAPCPVAVASTGPPTDELSRIGVAFAPTEDGEQALRAAGRRPWPSCRRRFHSTPRCRPAIRSTSWPRPPSTSTCSSAGPAVTARSARSCSGASRTPCSSPLAARC